MVVGPLLFARVVGVKVADIKLDLGDFWGAVSTTPDSVIFDGA
jgi:hypothetical protein